MAFLCKFLVSAIPALHLDGFPRVEDMITVALKMTKNDVGDTWIGQFTSVQITATTTLKG